MLPALLALAFLVLPLDCAAQQSQTIPALRPAQWREDLRFFADDVITHHRSPFHRVSRTEFDGAVEELDRRIPSLRNFEIVVGLQRLAAMIGDGHTFVATWGIQPYYPLDLFWFGHDLRVVRAGSRYRALLGSRVTRIGKLSIGELADRIKQVVPQGENQWYVLNQSAQQMIRADLLAALGATEDPTQATFVLEGENGAPSTVSIAAVPPDAKVDWVALPEKPPLHLRRAEEPFRFTYLSDSRAVYVSFRGYDQLAQLARKLFGFLDRHRVERLIIDMRHNGGGNYTLGREHLIYPIQMRPAVNRPGHLFVITGRETFSAGMTNAIDFRRETDALLVGEPPGARPQAFQENHWFTLPHSRLRVSVASLFYRFQDSDTPAAMPDHIVEPEWAAYRLGRDPVMEWILAYKARE